MIKTAKIVVTAVQLMCPECKTVVTASNGEQTIRKAMVKDFWNRWKHGDPFKCPHCKALFKLPANPFK